MEIGVREIYETLLETPFREIFTVTDHIKVLNKSRHLSKNQVNEIISLLHPDYQKLKVKIKFIHHKWNLKLCMFNPIPSVTIYANENSDCIAEYNSNVGCILIRDYKQQYKEKHLRQLHTIDSLFHELRHAWQYEHKYYKFMKDDENYIGGGNPGYRTQWIEKDAYRFACRMLNKHRDEINKILGIDWKWTASER